MASVGIPAMTALILISLCREEALLADRRGALSHEATLVSEAFGFRVGRFGFRVQALGLFRIQGVGFGFGG